ncbi:L,D-transpeptidase [Bacteroides gallinaceum]|uniref:L,D-transpeptidase n=1 Tax=Bacteroides gallinaceum TaxID=1462571 RepID=A0ABT7VIV5_9BACE|nr:L,D-transpeptidase [Bacteroides gallinaceum]MDM8326241.1 L,D-transpeptidase [Bacteroides gallinaceum]
MRRFAWQTVVAIALSFTACDNREVEVVPADIAEPAPSDTIEVVLPFERRTLSASDIILAKEFLYDKYTLEDTYPYQDTVRSFKWDIIRQCLAFVENIQLEPRHWAVLQNYKNMYGEAPVVANYVRNEFDRVSDTLGVERYQSVPLYLPADTVTPVRYGRDGSLVYLQGKTGSYCRLVPVTVESEWLAPERYVRELPDTTYFSHVIFVDRGDQNIATLERKAKGEWLVRSMNPATTGRHNPPYGHDTPLGMFVIQQKKPKMVFLKDGSQATGGYAPYASRFTNGAYIHGVPVNVPRTAMIEYSWSLGTTPRSHMCVRNATSHAKFIYDWAPTFNSLVVVIE